MQTSTNLLPKPLSKRTRLDAKAHSVQTKAPFGINSSSSNNNNNNNNRKMAVRRRGAAFAVLLATNLGAARVSAFHNRHHHRPHTPPDAGNPTAARRRSGFGASATTLPSRLSYAIDVQEHCPRDVPTMEAWVYECGVQGSGGLRLVGEADETNHEDYSLSTEEDIPANSPVLYVPSEMVLSAQRAMEEFGQLEESEKLITSLNAESELRHYYLMVKILVEWERGMDSPWYPWLNSLPRYFSNAASMTPFCYKCLPSLMSILAMKERANMNHLMIKKVPFLSVETRGNADLWAWAYNVVYTRSFEANNGSGDLCIAPMADYFNHGTETEVEMGYDAEGNCHVQTTRDVPAGSPLRMSYGDPTNPSFLLARYGFLDESSPATFCKYIPPHVNDELREMGYAHNRMLFFKDTGDASEEVWDVLLHQILSSSNIAKKRALYKAHLDGDYDTKRMLHEQYYSQTSLKLMEHIDTFLNQLDDLSAKSVGKDVNEHPRLPLILKHNEFVRNTFLAVRSRYFE